MCANAFLKKKIPLRHEREYFWSWHIWITDYKPDEHPDKWPLDAWGLPLYLLYPVTGGELQLYINSYWESTSENIVTNRFLMDRNLGAWSANKNDGYKTFGLYYQRGRKDPFPIANSDIQPVYDIDGNVIDVFNGAQTMIVEKRLATIADGVKYPYKLFESPYENTPDWCYDRKAYEFDNGWLNSNVEHYTEKSIFDPCPPGWMIPTPEAYHIQGDGTFGSRSGGEQYDPFGIDFHMYMNSSQMTWYPFNANRLQGSAVGYYWTAPTNGQCVFSFSDATVGGSFSKSTNTAGVRCMTVPSYK